MSRPGFAAPRRAWLVIAGLGVVSCGETAYDLFDPRTGPVDDDGVVPGTGGTMSVGDGGGDGDSVVGAGGGTGGSECTAPECPDASTGGSGIGGALAPPPEEPRFCPSENRPYLPLVQLRSGASNDCLVPGGEKTIYDQLAYSVTFAPCEDRPEQYWTMYFDAAQLNFEFRNETLGMNLDIETGRVGTIETPAVLFEPHLQYNQRFWAPRVEGEGKEGEPAVFIQTLNMPAAMCLTRVEDDFLIMPCTPDDVDQNQVVHVVPCFL